MRLAATKLFRRNGKGSSLDKHTDATDDTDVDDSDSDSTETRSLIQPTLTAPDHDDDDYSKTATTKNKKAACVVFFVLLILFGFIVWSDMLSILSSSSLDDGDGNTNNKKKKKNILIPEEGNAENRHKNNADSVDNNNKNNDNDSTTNKSVIDDNNNAHNNGNDDDNGNDGNNNQDSDDDDDEYYYDDDDDAPTFSPTTTFAPTAMATTAEYYYDESKGICSTSFRYFEPKTKTIVRRRGGGTGSRKEGRLLKGSGGGSGREKATMGGQQQKEQPQRRKLMRTSTYEVGPCTNVVPKKAIPKDGYTNGIDFFFFRDSVESKHSDRVTCMNRCFDKHVLKIGELSSETEEVKSVKEEEPKVDDENNNNNKDGKEEKKDNKDKEVVLQQVEVDNVMLIEAAKTGMIELSQKLLDKYGLDPLYRIIPEDPTNAGSLNAIQEAIRGGYTEIVQILSKGDNNLIIDRYGRSIKDYVVMNGSPIRPVDADAILGIKVPVPEKEEVQVKVQQGPSATSMDNTTVSSSGWNTTTNYPFDETTCDIDIIDSDTELSAEIYFRDYFVPGRPVVLRGQASHDELVPFSKRYLLDPDLGNWQDEKFSVGPTAYPSLSGQKRCVSQFNVEDLESLRRCDEMPDKPMVYAYHPRQETFKDLWPSFDGEVITHKRSSFRSVKRWFGDYKYNSKSNNKDDEINDNNNFNNKVLSWQVFMGGDGSGATYHWHEAAFNILYAGIKEWKIGPPYYRGFSGMPSKDVSKKLDPDRTLQCIQKPGDLFVIPNHWGHMTINHGFTIGAAGILRDSNQMAGVTNMRDLVLLEEQKQEESTGKINDNDKNNEKKGRGPGIRGGGEGRVKQLDKKKNDGKTDIYFVHINKTGGTSMVRMLSERCSKSHGDDSGEPNNMVYTSDNWADDNGVQHRTFHLTAHAHIERYGRQQWDDGYTFAIVRHPLARQVSNFFFLAGKDCTRKGNKCEERLIPVLNLDEMSDEDKISAFHEWISKLHDAFPPDHPEHYRFGAAGHGNEVYKTFGSTQTSWLIDGHDGKNNSSSSSIAVKDVFKLEELSGDISKLSGNIPCLGSLEKMYRKNETPKYPDYMLFAENKRTKKIINEVFADDFTNFNYEPL